MNHVLRISSSTRSCRLHKNGKGLENLCIQAEHVRLLATNGKGINANGGPLRAVGALERQGRGILAGLATSEADTTRQLLITRNKEPGDEQIWRGYQNRDRNRRIETLRPSMFFQLGQRPCYLDKPGSSRPIVRVGTHSKIPIPMATKTAPLMGFFYYHLPAGRPAISGEVRFRVTSTANPGSFSEGYDLMNPEATAIPWRIRLVTMPHSKHFKELLLQLVIDDLISIHLRQSIINLAQQPNARAVSSKSNAIFTFEDDFIVPLSRNCSTTIGIYTEKEQHVSQYRFLPVNSSPYKSGLIRARFERVVHPIDPSRRMVQVRCLEILEPVEFFKGMEEDYVPRAGELIQEKVSAKGSFQPWQRYLDVKMFEGLNILW